jgi:hypothetical protein
LVKLISHPKTGGYLNKKNMKKKYNAFTTIDFLQKPQPIHLSFHLTNKYTYLTQVMKLFTFAYIIFFWLGCGKDELVKDISAVFPDRIEVKLEDIKNLEFITDTNSHAKSFKFGDLNLPPNTHVFFSLKDSSKIGALSPKELFEGDSVLTIPCCTMKDTYPNVPYLVPYDVCFWLPDLEELPIKITTQQDRPLVTADVKVKIDKTIASLHCRSGFASVMATVVCYICPGRDQCAAVYTLFGNLYLIQVNVPIGYPRTRVNTTIACSNCPSCGE